MEKALTEALTAELATGKVGGGLELTSEQKTIGIQSPLVYIAGLVQILLKRSQSSFVANSLAKNAANDLMQGHFLKLQKLYQEKSGGGTGADGRFDTGAVPAQSFHWSPRLLPRADQQRLIDKDFASKLSEMEKHANSIADELMVNETGTKKEHERMKETNSVRKKKKKSHKMKAGRKDLDEIREGDEENLKQGTDTLEELINMQIQNSTTYDDSSQAWVEVKKKGGKDYEPRFPIQNMALINQSTEDSLANILDHSTSISDEYIDEAYDTIANEVPSEVSDDLCNAAGLGEREMKQDPRLNLTQASTVQNKYGGCGHDDDDDDPLVLKERIQQLQLELLQKDILLKEEQMKHMKLIREEKERFSDQMRAVQMRLYISETRLRNYEDALKNHVEAVSNSVSSSYIPSIPDDRGPPSKSISSVLIKKRLTEE